jgi:hypothetical protein
MYPKYGNNTYVSYATAQVLMAYVVVSNTGGATATNIQVSLAYGAYGGFTSALTNGLSIAAGNNENISVTVTLAANAAALVSGTITATANGKNQIIGNSLTAATGTLTSVTVLTTAILSVTFSAVNLHPGNGTWVGGQTFNAYVTVSNTGISAKAVNVVVTLTFGGYGGLMASASSPVSIPEGNSANITVPITVLTTATNINPVTITATSTGNNEISGDVLTAATGMATAIIKQAAALSITSFISTPSTGNGTYIANTAFSVKIFVQNTAPTGSARVLGVTISLTFGSYTGLSASNSSASLTIDPQVTAIFYIGVSVSGTATSSAVTISATASGTQEITGSAISSTASTLSVAVKALALLSITGFTITPSTNPSGNGTFIGGMTFSVKISVENTAATGSARALSVTVSLTFGGYGGMSRTNSSSSLTIDPQVTAIFYIGVSVSSSATSQNPVTISATATGTEEVYGRALSAGPSTLNTLIKAQAALLIQSVTMLGSNGPYVGGMNFVVRVSVQNTAVMGSAKAIMVTVALNYGGYSSLSSNTSASKTIAVGLPVNFDLNVTIAAGAPSQNNVTINATFTAYEEISLRSLNGVSASGLIVPIQQQANVAITSVLVHGTPAPPFVGGMTFTVEITYSNTGGTAANSVNSTFNFGTYTGCTVLSGTSFVTVNAGASGITQDFTISITSGAGTNASVWIHAAWTGTEQYSDRALNGDSTGNNLHVPVQEQASTTISSITTPGTNGTYVGGMTFAVRVSFSNTGGTAVNGITAALAFTGSGLSANGTNHIMTIAADGTGHIDFLITVATTATTQATISATWNGTEAISLRSLNGASSGSNNLGVTILQQASLSVPHGGVYILNPLASDEYVAGMNFTVQVLLTNSGGVAAQNVTAGLDFQGNSYMTTNASVNITIDPGITRNIDLQVYVAAAAASGIILFGATWAGQEAISNRTLPGGDSLNSLIIGDAIIDSQASVTITGISYRTGTGTYVAGMTAVIIRVTFQNTGGVSATVMGTLAYGAYSYMYVPSADLPPAISVPVGGSASQDFPVSIENNAQSAAVTISATWSGTERISNRFLSGSSGSANLPVTIESQANITVTGISWTSGNGTYVGGMTFTIRVTVQNYGGVSATKVMVTPSFGGYAYLLDNSSGSITVPAGLTGHLDFLMRVAASAITQSITISATCTGTEAISGFPLTGTSGTNNREVTILSQAQISVSSILVNVTNSQTTPNVWVAATVILQNTGGTPVSSASVTLVLNSTWAQSPTAVNQSTGLYIPANARIGVQIQFFVSASIPNDTGILIKAGFSGTETIENVPAPLISASNTTLKVLTAPFNVSIQIVGGRLSYVKGRDSFLVAVSLNNSVGTTNVINGTVRLNFAEISGFSANATSYSNLTIGIRTIETEYFNVTVAGSAPLGPVSFDAVFSGNKPEYFTKDSANVTITTFNQANVAITGITYQTGNGTYVAGMSFVIRVAFQNSGTSAAYGNVSAVLGYGGYVSLSSNSSGWLIVPAGATEYQYFSVTIAANAASSAVTISATWTGTEQYSNRFMSGGSSPYNQVITILAHASISITNITYTAPGGLFNGGSFTVDVYFNNTGGADVTGVTVTLVYPSWLTPSAPGPKTIYAGSSGYIEFTVYIHSWNVTGSIGATFTGYEAITQIQLIGSSGNLKITITIPAPSNLLITSITIPSGNMNYTAGGSFQLRVTFENTGGLDADDVKVTIGPAGSLTSTPPPFTVPAHESYTITVNVSIPASDQKASFNILVSFTWKEQYSNTPNGSEESSKFVINITPQINLTELILLAVGIAAVIGVGSLAARPRKEREQIIPGKKKTCKQCGKYVKPYSVTCPYCGYKLSEEESITEAMNKLRHLFIFHEESGVCLFYHAFTDSKIDPQLISGFLSAITSFGGQFNEATKKKGAAVATSAGPAKEQKSTGSDLKELVYKEYRILMETSGPCKFAVLIAGQTSKVLTFKISQFVKHFMRTYDEVLKDWKGNVRVFKDVDKMVRLIFGLTRVQEGPEKPAPAQAGAKPAAGTVAPEAKPPSPPPAGSKASSGNQQRPAKPVLPSSTGKKPKKSAKNQEPDAATSGVPAPGNGTSTASGPSSLKGKIGAPGESMPAKNDSSVSETPPTKGLKKQKK